MTTERSKETEGEKREGQRKKSSKGETRDPGLTPLLASFRPSFPSPPDRGTSIHSFARSRARACTTYRASSLISIYSWKENRLHSTSNRLLELGSDTSAYCKLVGRSVGRWLSSFRAVFFLFPRFFFGKNREKWQFFSVASFKSKKEMDCEKVTFLQRQYVW